MKKVLASLLLLTLFGGYLAAGLEEEVKQRRSPTCYFLASLASVARNKTDLRDHITDLGDNDYTVRLYVDGKWTEVPVTFDEDEDDDLNDPAPVEDEEDPKYKYWPTLFQRAYLKATTVEKRNVVSALQSLTGKSVEIFYVDKAEEDVLKIQTALKQGLIVVGATFGKDKKILAAKTGLVGPHAYSIFAADKDEEGWYLLLRNPWGRDIDTKHLEEYILEDGTLYYIWAESGQPYEDGIDDDPDDGFVIIRLEDFKKFFHYYWVG